MEHLCNINGKLVLYLLSSFVLTGCFENVADGGVSAQPSSIAINESARGHGGKRLFEQESFDGNDRSCATCHRGGLRSVTPEEASSLYSQNPDDPLFSHDAADEFPASTKSKDCQTSPQGECRDNFERFLNHATISVAIDLPPNVQVFGSKDKVILNRGIPTTLDIALDSVFMSDGRASTLHAQAIDAAQTHAEVSAISVDDLDAIVEFESSEFSSPMLAKYAAGGEEPVLPEGSTESERRGRDFFVTPEKKGRFGFCGMCHSGPMLNEVSVDILLPPPLTDQSPGLEARVGDRFFTALVSEVNSIANRPRLWVIEDEGVKRMILSPDIGRAAITGKWSDVNKFKIPSLWGSNDRAPFFHDNSAKSVEDMVDHYVKFAAPSLGITLTLQDKADIIAYMKLL